MRRLRQLGARLNGEYPHAWVKFSQAIALALGAGLATSVICGAPHTVLLWLAWPMMIILGVGFLWVLATYPDDRARMKKNLRDLDDLIARCDPPAGGEGR